MKLYYYQARIKINATVLLEFLKKKALLKNDEIVEVYDVYGTIFIATSKSQIMKEIENLYPTVFQTCEPISFKGRILFTTY